MLVDFFETHLQVGGLERVLFVGRGERRQRRRDEIHQPAGLVNVHGHGGKFVGKSGRTSNNLLEQREHVALQRLDFRGYDRRRRLRHGHDLARINGVSWVNSPRRTRSRPSANTNRLWLGIFTTLCTTAEVPMVYKSLGCGESTRASRCATTMMVLSSPSELISWTELSRPTVRGKTAWGNRTVSRTGSTGRAR